MAQPTKPNNADFIGNLAQILADRKEEVRKEFLRIDTERNIGFSLLNTLKRHIDVLGSLPAFSDDAPAYQRMYNEAVERENALNEELERLAEKQQQLKTEFNVLNSLQADKGTNLK